MEQHVAQLLANTLSPNQTVRTEAEAGLSELSTHGEAGLVLSHILLAQDAEISLRQSAGFVLKKYVKEHWSIAFQTFLGSPPDAQTKEGIRQAVLNGLSDTHRKIRLACANVISEIASSDWPDEWPELLNSLLQLLSSGKPDSVHGAMRVMSDFVSSELSEDQLLPLASAILPQLLQILGNQNAYSAVTRAQSIHVFRQCLSTLYMVKENHPQAAAYATQQVLPQWVEAFNQLLSASSLGDAWGEMYIRNAIFQTLSTILISFPKSLSSSMASLIVEGVQDLTRRTSLFRDNCLNDDLDGDFPTESEDGESLTIPQYTSNVFEFIASAARKTSGRSVLVQGGSTQASDVFAQITYLALYYAQITSEDEERWHSDMEAYVADEDEDIPAATVRTAALDLMAGFCNSSQAAAALETVMPAMSRLMEEADRLQSEGQSDWWKGYESCLTLLCSISDELGEHFEQSATAGSSSLNIETLFNRLVVPFLPRSDIPFLQGRALIFASCFAKQLPPHVQQQFFESSIQAFESQSEDFVIKICALRALKNFAEQIPEAETFSSLGNRIATNLLPFVGQAQSAVLILVLETLQKLLSLNTIQNDAHLCRNLSAALLEPIANNATNDPLVSATLCDLYRSLASSPVTNVYESIRDVALPRLAQMLAQGETEETRQQIVSSVVTINSIFDGRPTPLGDGLFGRVANELFSVLSQTEDDNILQEGLESLTFVVRKDVDQLINWSSPTGQNGLTILFSIIARVLHPDRSESGGLFVGDLLLHVFRKAANQIVPILPDLLRALVLRLSTALTATFSQSLILPFAYLMHSQVEVVLQLLENMEVDGKRGLDVLMTTWCDLVDTFHGFWSIRVSTAAFVQLLLSNRPSLNQLVVKGDLIVNPANSKGIVTRSRSKKNPDQYTQIPCRAKILKVLLKELEQASEPADAEEEISPAGGDDADDWEDDEEAIKQAIDLSSFLGGSAADFLGDGDGDDDDDADEDLKSDPVYTMDVWAHLADAIRTFASTDKPAFDACLQYLNSQEIHTLHSI